MLEVGLEARKMAELLAAVGAMEGFRICCKSKHLKTIILSPIERPFNISPNSKVVSFDDSATTAAAAAATTVGGGGGAELPFCFGKMPLAMPGKTGWKGGLPSMAERTV